MDDASDILSESRSEHEEKDDTDRLFGGSLGLSGNSLGSHQLSGSPLSVLSGSTSSLTSPQLPSSCMGSDSTPQKPRIWSLADVATSNNNNRALPSLQGMPQPAHLGAKLPGGPMTMNGDSFNPVNGFRPWVNGSSNYGPPPQQGPGATTQQQNNPNLLRPYPLAPRTEVH